MEITKEKEKLALGVMTVAIAICSSTFAAEYGENFDWRYSLLFFVALAALTFHYAKFIPKPVLSVMRVVTIIGLVFFTVFVSVAAWLDKGTSQVDPEVVAVQERIDTLKSQISDRNLEIAALFASGNPVNARRVSDEKSDIEERLNHAQREMTKLKSHQGAYESGSMAIFGHIAKITGQDQELVNLVVMGTLLLVMVCMEITMGAALTSNYTVVKRKEKKSETRTKNVPKSLNSTENDTNTAKSSTNTPPQKTKGVHTKNRERVRKFVSEYRKTNGKYPTREEVRLACSVGPAVAGEVLKEIKGKEKAA